MPRNAHHRPQVVFAAVMVLGGIIAWTVPRTVEGKFLLLGFSALAATVLFAAMVTRARRARAEQQARMFLEQALREAPKRPATPPPSLPRT